MPDGDSSDTTIISNLPAVIHTGEVISGPGNFEIEVLDADPRRVKKLRIGPRKERPVVRPRGRRDSGNDAASPPQANDNSTSRPGDSAGSQ